MFSDCYDEINERSFFPPSEWITDLNTQIVPWVPTPKQEKPCTQKPEVTLNIYRGLYEWYLNENLSLSHKSKHRSHFCLLSLIQRYLDYDLKEHSQDSLSVAIGDKYKRCIKCNGEYLDTLLDDYFYKTVEFRHTEPDYWSAGYQLREEHMEAIFQYMNKNFAVGNPFEYVCISDSKYKEVPLYRTELGLVATKKEALAIEGLTRRQEDRLVSVTKNVLVGTTVSHANAYKINFKIPKGYHTKVVRISRDHLIDLINKSEGGKRALLFFMKIFNAHERYPHCVYKLASTGRWFGTQKINDVKYLALINYQGMPKKQRKVVFKGMYEYDIATSAPSILSQMYHEYYPDEPLVHIQNYIDNKKALRIEWARLLGGDQDKSIDVVKAVLTSLFFGAQLTQPEYITKQVSDTVTMKQLKVLHRDPKFTKLVNETTHLFDKLAAKRLIYPRRQKTLSVTNAVGVVRDFTKKEKNKAIAHLYQGIEVSILEAFYGSHGDEIALYIHDAIISKSKLDPKELSDIAFEASEYHVKFEEEVIG